MINQVTYMLHDLIGECFYLTTLIRHQMYGQVIFENQCFYGYYLHLIGNNNGYKEFKLLKI